MSICCAWLPGARLENTSRLYIYFRIEWSGSWNASVKCQVSRCHDAGMDAGARGGPAERKREAGGNVATALISWWTIGSIS